MSNTQSLYDLLKAQECDDESANSGLSLEKWKELGDNGVVIPMKIPLHGSSMKPLIRPERDIVTIMPLIRAPMIGDIVLFRRIDGKNIVHRVYKISSDWIQTWGDNCRNADAPIKRNDIYGIIVSVEKRGKTYQLDTDKQRSYGIRWMKYGKPLWKVIQKIRKMGGCIIRKVNPSFHADRDQ